jgi:hypothetical protein
MQSAVFGAIACMLMVPSVISASAETVGQASDSQTALSAQEKADDRQCVSYGAKPGTGVYVDCRLKLVELRQQSDPAPSTGLMRCRSIAFGGIVRTRCK